RFALITGLGYTFQTKSSGGLSFLRNLVCSLYRFSLRRADLVFFQNPDDESLFRDQKIISPKTPSCIVNGSGIHIDRFAVAGFPGKLRFLMIARLLGDKGVREYAGTAQIGRASCRERASATTAAVA